jgi:hypothetical protein
MKRTTLALALVAGTICVGNFLYKWLALNRLDYMILLAGIFIISFGIANRVRKKG